MDISLNVFTSYGLLWIGPDELCDPEKLFFIYIFFWTLCIFHLKIFMILIKSYAIVKDKYGCNYLYGIPYYTVI